MVVRHHSRFSHLERVGIDDTVFCSSRSEPGVHLDPGCHGGKIHLIGAESSAGPPLRAAGAILLQARWGR
jgi:hypothetical protein